MSRGYQVGTAVVTALDAVDLEIDAGEFAVVLGPSSTPDAELVEAWHPDSGIRGFHIVTDNSGRSATAWR